SDNIHPQPFRHGNNGVDDTGVIFLVLDVIHKAAVDFESVDRQLLQVGQGGVASAKIVNGNANPLFGELVQLLVDDFQVGHDHVFSQLDFQVFRGEIALSQRVEDLADKTGMFDQ